MDYWYGTTQFVLLVFNKPGNQAIIHMANRTIIKETRAVLTTLYPYQRPIYVIMYNCQLLKVPPRLTDCIISENNNDFEKVVHTKSHIFIQEQTS